MKLIKAKQMELDESFRMKTNRNLQGTFLLLFFIYCLKLF